MFCHCSVPDYIFVFSVNRQIACRRKLRASHLFKILLFVFSLWSEWLPSAIFLVSFPWSSPWPCFHLPLHHLICRVELLCLPVKLCSCKNYPSSSHADSFFFFSHFAIQVLCGELWFISNIISKLILFKWHFSAVFKSKLTMTNKILL